MTTKAWGKPGAWAQDVEENEATKQEAADFPSLAASAASKPKKKKQHQTLSLSEFTTGTHIGPGAKPRPGHQAEPKGLTPDEMLMLPTGPRQRSPQELEQPGSLGGGFRGYGAQTRDRDSNRDFGRSSRRDGFDADEPSRADTSDHWGSAKNDRAPAPAPAPAPGRDSASKADEADDWSVGKKFTPSDRKFGGRAADDSDNWASGKNLEARSGGGPGFETEARDRWSKRGSDGRSGFDFFQREGGPEGDRWARREESGVRPRLVLQPRTSPISDGDDGASGAAPPPRPRSTNPFGEARPREQVLAEKGHDWKKIDEELGSRGWTTNSAADRHGEAAGAGGDGAWRCNSPVDWGKKDAAQNGQSLRLEESGRAVNGKESLIDDSLEVPRSPSNDNDVNELIRTEKELEQLTNDVGQKVHVSHRSDVGYDRTARW